MFKGKESPAVLFLGYFEPKLKPKPEPKPEPEQEPDRFPKVVFYFIKSSNTRIGPCFFLEGFSLVMYFNNF